MNRKMLDRYFKNTCTDSERAEVVEWLAAEKNSEEVKNYISANWLAFESDSKEETHLEFEAIRDKIAEDGLVKPKEYTIWKVLAAACVVLVVFGIAFLMYIQNADTGLNEDRLIVVETEMGERKWVRLSDGSEVYLNGNSKLTYSKARNDAHKAVFIEGEAFFKVANNRSSMEIKSGDYITVVNGASTFNISAFPKDSTIILSLGEKKGTAEIRSTNESQPMMKLRMVSIVKDSTTIKAVPMEKLTAPIYIPATRMLPAVAINGSEYAVVNKKQTQIDVYSKEEDKPIFDWKDEALYFENAETGKIIKVNLNKYQLNKSNENK